MTTRWTTWLVVGSVPLACGGDAPRSPGEDTSGASRGFEAPVLMNPEAPVRYPATLYNSRTDGSVVLRLYVNEAGTVIPESTRVAEGSGQAAFDSAAVAGVPAMRFAPARRDGLPVATLFLQPVHFRHPQGPVSGGGR
ncbi:MAG: TonB family protein [Gemmatimonadota bacterium]|nr:TonB family protein [Gemmatimonadota bacterium]